MRKGFKEKVISRIAKILITRKGKIFHSESGYECGYTERLCNLSVLEDIQNETGKALRSLISLGS